MKWDLIEITDHSGTIHKGEQARKFVEANCSKVWIKTYRKGKIAVELPTGLSAKPEIVEAHLKDILWGKAKGLKVKSGSKPLVINFPVARAVQNVVNISLAKLKVQFIHKRDAEKIFLEHSHITVKALREGTTEPLTKAANNRGIVDFGVVIPGKYTITLVWDECKYDGLVETHQIELAPLSEKIMEFEVELLYQKVQFIAHTLATIPHQTFVLSGEDNEKLEVTEADGKRTFAFKSLSTPGKLFTKGDLKPPLPADRGMITANPQGVGKLALKEKKFPIEYWKLSDLDLSTLHLDKLEIKSKVKENPEIYDLEYKAGFGKDDLTEPLQNEKASIGTFPTLRLMLKKKTPPTEFWRKDDLDQATLDPEKIEIVRQIGSNPDVYDIKFKTEVTTKQFEVENLSGQWRSKYHGFLDDGDDINARLKFVADTLEKAFANSDKDPTVLKAFMIPECFFQGLYGAYIADDAAKLVEELQNLVKDKKWKDWIFSFGTVNRVFLGVQPKIVTDEENKTIYEMANHAPVIRGGLEAFNSTGDSTRLIQKLLNSAELADADELLKDSEVTRLIEQKKLKIEENKLKVGDEQLTVEELRGEDYLVGKYQAKRIRPQAVNDDVQFEATENDHEVAKFLERLLADNIKYKYLLLTDELETEIKKLGIARVARQIRISGDTDSVFSEWKKTLQDYEQTVKKLDQDLELKWAERLKTAESLEESQRLEAIEKVMKEKAEHEPLKTPVPFNLAKESMSLEDYVFACPRKVGPLFKSLEEAEKLKPCKRLIFGLEICADHADTRINNINTEPSLIDIHLIPSAGMKPKKFAARNGGYIFNCDGWNQRLREAGDDEEESDKKIREDLGFPKDEGGRNVVTHLDGPSPYIKTVKGVAKQTSPIYPHSAVAKRTSADPNVSFCLKPSTIIAPNAELSKVIFAYGPGELHFYPLQDLPK